MDRHEKWTKVIEDTVTGGCRAPWRVEFTMEDGTVLAFENILDSQVMAGLRERHGTPEWFVDSSWKPPLVLPTEPTWGIAFGRYSGGFFAKWRRDDRHFRAEEAWRSELWLVADVLDFIPLTPEQVARIEAAR